jgi:hypothetical protein
LPATGALTGAKVSVAVLEYVAAMLAGELATSGTGAEVF